MMATIQNRIPVILEQDAWPAWRCEDEGYPVALLRPANEDLVKAVPVCTAVNSMRNNGAQLLSPA